MRFPSRAIAVWAALLCLAGPGAAEAAYTSTVSSNVASMTGDASGDLWSISSAGGLFRHNRWARAIRASTAIPISTALSTATSRLTRRPASSTSPPAPGTTRSFSDNVDLRGQHRRRRRRQRHTGLWVVQHADPRQPRTRHDRVERHARSGSAERPRRPARPPAPRPSATTTSSRAPSTSRSRCRTCCPVT